MLIAKIFIWLLLLNYIYAGCYQKRLCCPGNNVSCTATDDGIGHLPLMQTTASSLYKVVYDDKHRKIGKLVAEDFIELEGSAENIYDKYC